MTVGKLRNYYDVGRADEEGRTVTGHFRKVPSQATTANNWADLSMAAGNPIPNYYASDPLTFATLNKFRGIFHGDDKGDAGLFLQTLELVSPTAGFLGEFILCDYLGYYPFIDLDDLTQQTMDNTVTLPRYEDGDGVEVICVQLTPQIGGGTFTFTYVDQNGVTGTSPTIQCGTGALNIASLVNSNATATSITQGPFLPKTSVIGAGATGIRSITSVTPLTANGGLVALVLVKPLATMTTYEINTTTEVQFLGERLSPPKILDGAYLNLLVRPNGSIAAGLLAGRAKFIWN